MPSYSFESASERGSVDSTSKLDVGRLEPFVIEMIDRKEFAADAFVQATCCHKFVGSMFP